MGLRTKVELSWRGVDYPLLVDMEVISRVDDKINIGTLLTRHLANDIRHSHSAKFLSLMLCEAGAKVTQEEVYIEMFSSDGVSLTDVKEFNEILFSACFNDSKKKEESQA